MFTCLRQLFLVTFLAALLAPAHALILLLPKEDTAGPLPVRDQKITVKIDERAARTTWRTTFFNPHGRDLEGTFLFTLPEDAQVSDFAIRIDGKELRGEVLPRDEARNIYEGIVRRLRDPGLLEHLDDRTVKLRVFPLRANQESDVEIEYLQTLRRENGMISYEIDQSFPAGVERSKEAELAIELNTQDAIGLLQSPTHKLNVKKDKDGTSATVTLEESASFDGNFTLFFNTSATDLGMHFIPARRSGEEEGTFLLIINVPEEGPLAQPLRKDVVFVLDTSGSMSDEGELDKAQAALRQCLQALNPEDTFGLVQFSTMAQTFRPEMRAASKENIDEAAQWLKELRARGGTNIHQALQKAVELLQSDSSTAPLRQVIFFTDGQPTVGKTDPVQITALLPEQTDRPLRVFTLGFGYDVNTTLLDDVAAKSGAFSDYIHPDEDLELTITSLFKAISSPMLTDVKIMAECLEIVEQYPPDLPDLFLGKETIVAGTFKGKGEGTLTLSGTANKEDFSSSVKLSIPEKTAKDREYVRAIWANRKVGYLVEQIRKNGFSEELKEEIVSLALEYNLVTPYTSFLAAPDEEYALAPATVGTGGTRREAREARLNADLLSSRSKVMMHRDSAPGEAEVRASEVLRQQKEVSASSQSDKDRMKSQRQRQQVFVDGSEFIQNESGIWVQQATLRKSDIVQIKYLSKAYYELLQKYPEVRSQVLVGEKVQLVINNQWVEIGEEGAAEKLPDF
jgi:Ca-activated chloride channel family protein